MSELGARFWGKVDKSGDCWLWTGSKKEFGYGQYAYRGKPHRAHRLSWEEANGQIPDGLWVLHECNTPACVRPSHLRLGTHKDNMRHMADGWRSHKGERAPLSRLTTVDVLAIRGMALSRLFTQAQIASRYSITQSHVSRLASYEAWSHL